MLREELYHPMISHFPIVMFFLALVTKLVGLSLQKLNKDSAANILYISRLLMYTAPFTFLISMYLGDFALDQIKNDFCDLYIVYQHEEVAYYALYSFLLVLGFEAISEIKSKFKVLLQYASLLFLLVGNFYLFKTAHSGAGLVYDLGAAVKVAPKCN